MVEHAEIALGPGAQDHQTSGIATVIEDHVGGATIAPLQNAVGEGPVLIKAFALIGKNRNIGGRNRGGGVVLGGEDIAAGPAHLGPQGGEGFDQHRCLNRHVQGTGDPGALERLIGAIFTAQGH